MVQTSLLDLLRDPSLVTSEANLRWRCGNCSNALNKEEVENRLIDEVEKLTASFLLQDFRCSKTKLASKRNATNLSPLSEPSKMDKPKDKFQQELLTLQKVATLHTFGY